LFDSLSVVGCLNIASVVDLASKENMRLFDFDLNIYPFVTNIRSGQTFLAEVKLLLVKFIILFSIAFSFKNDGISSSIIRFSLSRAI
jgi:hypothetical protein